MFLFMTQIDVAIENLNEYLDFVKSWDEDTKKYNQKAWHDALEMAAWLSVYKYGNEYYSKIAKRIIIKLFGG